MSQHNITGSEAFTPSPHILIRVVRRARRPWHPAMKLCAAAGVIGAIASLIDSWVGAPVCLTLCLLVIAGLMIWPDRA